MKIGQIFNLPPDVDYFLGRIGKMRNPDKTKVIGKYEVVEVQGELKGRVIVTYGNKRRKANGQ